MMLFSFYEKLSILLPLVGNSEYKIKKEALAITERKNIEKFFVWTFLGEQYHRNS